MKRYLVHSITFLIIAVLMTGCGDGDPTGPENEGSFSVSITGDINKNITGSAWFWSGTVEGEEGFVIWLSSELQNNETGESLWFAREGATRPGSGTYVIGNFDSVDEDEWNPQHFFAWYVGTGTYIWSESGSITVTVSSSNRFAGSFQYTGVGYSSQDWESELEVTISGDFDAVGGDFQFPDFKYMEVPSN